MAEQRLTGAQKRQFESRVGPGDDIHHVALAMEQLLQGGDPSLGVSVKTDVEGDDALFRQFS
ncbi:hypothetical protein H8F06_21605 [Vibrio fluvialis]|uniref:hypothetical protein n=1 Tax=Vibrio fluvialis TaxID=676 RepID=UPI00192B806D|nr:hypothetical protein [Vibrio fluvialis]MBL4297879.1 hypothetical protein [Vibrio fluvialis]